MEMYVHSHFGVYARIVNARNELLLIKKARGPYTGMYDLPGGSPEPMELLEEIVSREVLEETGCTVTAAEQLRAVSSIFEYQKDGQPAALRHMGVLFDCQIDGDPRTDGDGEDSNGCVWIPLDEVASHSITPFVKEVI